MYLCILLLFTGITVPLAGPDNHIPPPSPLPSQPPAGMVTVVQLQQELHTNAGGCGQQLNSFSVTNLNKMLDPVFNCPELSQVGEWIYLQCRGYRNGGYEQWCVLTAPSVSGGTVSTHS